MRLDDKIFFSYLSDQWISDTDGVINIDITRGVDKYIGPWQQPDAGVLTLTTRNSNLDPYINSNIRINTKVRIETDYESYSYPIFTGWISDINVEYQPNGEPPIITIQAIDVIGRLQKTSISESFETYLRGLAGNGVTLLELMGAIDMQDEFDGIGVQCQDYSDKMYSLTYAPKAGESVWEILAQYAENLLGFFIVDGFGVLRYLPYNKYYEETQNSWFGNGPAEYNPSFFFASDGSAASYKSILLDAGFDRTINQVSFKNNSRHYNGTSNFNETNSEWGPYAVTDSITEWGPARLDMATIWPQSLEVNQTFEDLARDILEVTANPSVEVLEITYDAYKYGLIDIPFKINIKHNVTNAIQIDKDYNIVGIKHSINNTQWLTTLVLRDFLSIEEMIPEPIIVMDTATTGDSNFNFHAHIGNATEIGIGSILWDFAGWSLDVSTFTSTDLTPTWNYDYHPDKDWYGAGYYSLAVYVTNTAGWTRRSFLKDANGDEVQLEVTAAVPNAQYTYTTSDNGVAVFTDQSYDADTWLWNFGDGNTSTLQNPTHTYLTTGTYTVTLEVSNGVSTDTETKSIAITVGFIPVKYIKYHITGSKTKSGSVWTPNKYWVDIKDIVGIFRYSPSGTQAWENSPSTITVTKGTAYIKNSSGTTLLTINQGSTTDIGEELTDLNTNNYLQVVSPYLNSGNTEEVDVTIIQDVSLIDNTSDISVVLIPNANWDSQKYHFEDAMLIPRTTNSSTTYFPMEVFVSGDGTTWKKVGDLDPTSIYTPTFFYLKNKVSVPPTP